LEETLSIQGRLAQGFRMASCQPKVPEIKYSDERWWQDFFTKDLAEFYASLNGLLRARETLLKELSGDLAQVLADPRRRDLALRVLSEA
jgi:hypothetical protein